MRIVSLLGSATEIVYELGLDDHLVGISHECDFPASALRLPRVSRPRFDPVGLTSGDIDAAVRRCMEEFGGVYEVDRELLGELRPDLVLTQAVCEVCAVPTGSVEDAVATLPRRVEVVSLDAHTIDGIFGTIRQVAEAAGRRNRGMTAEARLRKRLDDVTEAVRPWPQPRVLMLEWLDPPFAPGHWVPEMVALAGGENLIGRARERSEQVGWEQAGGFDPDVLLVEPCGFDLEQAAADAAVAESRLRAAAPRAFAERAWLLHSAWFSRSGPRVVEGVETLARVLHPGAFPEDPNPRIARRWP
ncbi:MAG: cobalamin-binding protein [Gemmatimonadota bacterium]